MKESSQFYLARFNLEDIKYFSASDDKNLKLVDDIEAHDHGYLELDEFGIYMLAEGGHISESVIADAMEVLSQVVELDKVVRSQPNEEGHSYDLQNIEVRNGTADFFYCSNEANATWYALFEKTESGWKYAGLG